MNDAEYDAYIKTCPEVELYFAIDTFGGFVWRMNHDLADGRIESSAGVEQDIINMQGRMEIAIDQSVRFGVIEPRKDGRASESYWRWFRWWDAWSKAMSNAQFREVDRAITNHEDLSRFRPDGDWKDTEELVSGL